MGWIGLIAGNSGDSLADQLINKGYKVLIIVGKDFEPGVKNATEYLVEDLSNKEKILKKLKEYCIDKVVIGTGHIKAIELTAYLETNGIDNSLNIEVTKLAKDKILFKKKLDEIGLLTPSFLSMNTNIITPAIKNQIEKIGFPLVVKSSIDLTQPEKVKNYEELLGAISEINETGSEILIEEFIKGSDCTVHVTNDGENTEILGVKYWSKAKEKQLKGFDNSYSLELTNELEEKIKESSRKLMLRLNVLGYCKVDFTVEGDKAYILEINTVTLTGYNSSSYKYFAEKKIDISKKMVDTALNILYKKSLN